MLRKLNNFAVFFNNAAEKGLLLLFVSLIAFIFANSESKGIYNSILHANLSIEIASFVFSLSFQHFINDFLMAVFFFAVGLEIKRELIEGHLCTKEQRILPFIAAIGGVIVPVLIYTALNYQHHAEMRGWAIPSATDIAFALGMLALFGRGLPISIRVFLAALAIIDDLFAVLIIALFYTNELSINYVGFIIIMIGILLFVNRIKISSPMVYCILGLILWYLFYKSGIHTTVGGVFLAFAVPLRGSDNYSPLKSFEKIISPYVIFIILPLFAFANTGITVDHAINLHSTVVLGCLLGLFFGKQIGVFLTSLLLFKFGFSRLPANTNLLQFYGVSVLCGIGFTMSLFIAILGFDTHEILLEEAKLGIIAGSILSAIYAAIILKIAK